MRVSSRSPRLGDPDQGGGRAGPYSGPSRRGRGRCLHGSPSSGVGSRCRLRSRPARTGRLRLAGGSDQAVAAKVLSDWLIEPVKRLRGVGLTREVKHLRRAQLQPGGQLIRGDPGVEPRIAFAGALMVAIERVQEREPFALALGREPGRRGREQVVNRLARRGTDHRPLIRRRQEARPPVRGSIRGKSSRVGQDDERRQVVVQTPQPIRHPRPHPRKARQDEPGVLHEGRRPVNI